MKTHNEEALDDFIDSLENGMTPILSIFIDTDGDSIKIAQSKITDPNDLIHILKEMIVILESQQIDNKNSNLN
jgi:hypothetical protein